jgi:hypothetical protein
MKPTRWMFSIVSTIVLGLLNGPAILGADKKLKAASAADQTQVVLDVAVDGRTWGFNRSGVGQTGVVRGDTFVVNGKIFPGGSIPSGDTTGALSPDSDGSIGTLICRGLFVVNAADLSNGVNISQASDQQFYLDEGNGLVTQGVEGTVAVMRAVIGGTGQYSGAIGQVSEEVLGWNETGGLNLRFTFNLVMLNPQAAAPFSSAKKR